MSTAPTLIYETVHGSRAYGLDEPGSDTDLKGIVVGPRAWYLGPEPGPEQVQRSDDHVHYELRKFVRLAEKANPSLLEVLFTHPDDHRVCTAAGQRLLDARHIFLSRRVADSFGGYALSQLQRIRGHRSWLLHPPEKAPTRADFGLPERRPISREQQGAAESMLEDGLLTEDDLPTNFLELLSREKRYRSAKRDWKQFQTWKRERNPARAALEAEFGYDTKHALHLVRLLRMGKEILEEGTVHVRRPDRDELLAIKHGAWAYEDLVAQAEALHGEIRTLRKTSALPETPDSEAIATLCVEIAWDVLSGEST